MTDNLKTPPRELKALALVTIVVFCALGQNAVAANTDRLVLIRDITSVEGVRDNMLIGYGLVVGLNHTGDSQQTPFTMQTLANAMQKMGVLVSPGKTESKNVAAVFITASLPPFARPGSHLDVTVSSVGDAKSLAGGVLLMSALHGPDGQIYAAAQGPLSIGSDAPGSSGSGSQPNSPTVGSIPNGGIVERDTSVDLQNLETISLLLRNPDFTAARQIADTVNMSFQRVVARAVDSSRVDVSVEETTASSIPVLISRIQNLSLHISTPAMIIVNQRTGTIAMGGNVQLTPVSVLHGDLSIDVVPSNSLRPPSIEIALAHGGAGKRVSPASQTQRAAKTSENGQDTSGPEVADRPHEGDGTSFANSSASGLPKASISYIDIPMKTMRLDEGASVEELVNGLHVIGATSRDVIAILQAIKDEGGLQAELRIQ